MSEKCRRCGTNWAKLHTTRYILDEKLTEDEVRHKRNIYWPNDPPGEKIDLWFCNIDCLKEYNNSA